MRDWWPAPPASKCPGTGRTGEQPRISQLFGHLACWRCPSLPRGNSHAKEDSLSIANGHEICDIVCVWMFTLYLVVWEVCNSRFSIHPVRHKSIRNSETYSCWNTPRGKRIKHWRENIMNMPNKGWNSISDATVLRNFALKIERKRGIIQWPVWEHSTVCRSLQKALG